MSSVPHVHSATRGGLYRHTISQPHHLWILQSLSVYLIWSLIVMVGRKQQVIFCSEPEDLGGWCCNTCFSAVGCSSGGAGSLKSCKCIMLDSVLSVCPQIIASTQHLRVWGHNLRSCSLEYNSASCPHLLNYLQQHLKPAPLTTDALAIVHRSQQDNV